MTATPTLPANNFEFLRDDFPSLYALGKEAKFLLYPDPAAALMKLRLYWEKLVERFHSEPATPSKDKRGRKAKSASEVLLFK